MGRRRMAERPVKIEPAPYQPAAHTDDHAGVGLFGHVRTAGSSIRVSNVIAARWSRSSRCSEIPRELVEAGQALTQGPPQVRLVPHAAADDHEATTWYAARIEGAEFVAQLLGEQQPQPRHRLRRHPAQRLVKSGRLYTGLK